MKFKKFTSIENSYREKYIEIIREYGYDKVRWLATEKIDGANFSFITDGKEVKVASRNQIVDGTFYHCQAVIDRYKDKVLKLKQIHFASADQIQVYGELFGKGIQNKIFYGEDKNFMAVEIQEDGVVVSTDDAAGLLTYVGIPIAPGLGVFGSLDKALELSPVFVSKVYDELYPDASVTQFELGENDAEGIVLKPVEPVYLPNGSRVILKYKNPAFSEKNKKKKKGNGETNPFIEIAEMYINENRMNAVLSKEGELTPKDYGRIIKLMAEDVQEDMIKDGDLPCDWRKLESHKMAGKGINTAVSKFLKEHLLPNL